MLREDGASVTLSTPILDSTAVRDQLHKLLAADLIGPWAGPDETIVGNPRGRYLAGALAPVKVSGDGQLAAEPTSAMSSSKTIDEVRAAEDPLVVATENGSAGVPEIDDGEISDGEEAAEAEDRGPTSQLIAPSSMGLRFRIAAQGPGLILDARWGTYLPRREADDSGRVRTLYDRINHDHLIPVGRAKLVPGAYLDEPVLKAGSEVLVSISVEVLADEADDSLVVEVALQNRKVTDGNLPPREWLFQAELEVVTDDGSDGFLPIHDPLVDLAPGLDLEEERLELLYRDRLEFAVGRTSSATWSCPDPADNDGAWIRDLQETSRRAHRVRTTWLPEAEVPQTTAPPVAGIMDSMRQLGAASQSEVIDGLRPLVDGYRGWLTERTADAEQLPAHLVDVAQEAIEDAEGVAKRLHAGLALLATPEVFRAFQFMNRVMAEQRIHSTVAINRSEGNPLPVADELSKVLAKGDKAAQWRPFQLGFILMQLEGLSRPEAAFRSGEAAQAELLFFPTGGGKTEAYLGLAAFAFAMRRLQAKVSSPDGPLDGRDGVAVLMRYTLRLLTTQQFQRATALVCAAELERLTDTETWGEEPFRIGLWVGSSVSPKSVSEAKLQVEDAKSTEGKAYGVTVLQLQRCPWCGTRISSKQHITYKADRRRILVHCGAKLGTECPFAEGGKIQDGLPVLTTDEEIYRYAPAFLLATVDKFARIAREGQAANLFGHVVKRCPRHGYIHPDTPADVCNGSSHPAKGPLPKATVVPVGRLRPPDLIIQDELHLITGALGTAVGLFEVAVDTLCSWRLGSDAATSVPIRPLVVASTATSRNAAKQVRSLFGRGLEIFPPQVLDIRDTYFSRELPVSAENPGRRYLGVCAHGARLTLAEIRVSEILLLAGQRLLDHEGDAADPYMTLVAYFSATRELAGMRRYLDDDVTTRITNPDKQSGYPARGFFGLEIGELTSRVSSTDITATLDRLAASFDPVFDTTLSHKEQSELRRAGGTPERRAGDRPYDVVLATSMLQVGVDVGRLGLMLVVGQPKNTAEYIQASSRVGRIASKPGLVVTLSNRARPRDMAHYEQFEHDHRTFYAHVEALSVTPYSDSSLERGLTAVLVSIARVLDTNSPSSLSPQAGAGSIATRFATVEHLIDVIAERSASAGADSNVAEIRAKLQRRLDAWYKKAQSNSGIVYDKRGGTSLLISPEAGQVFDDDVYLRVANSMREVQPEINFVVRSVQDRVTDAEPYDTPAWVFPVVTKA